MKERKREKKVNVVNWVPLERRTGRRGGGGGGGGWGGVGWCVSMAGSAVDRRPPSLLSSFLHVKLWLDFRVNLG